MAKSKGYRKGTRYLLQKGIREKGKLNLSSLLYEYKVGNKVIIKIDSAIHKGMPHHRFHGSIGTVLVKRGRCYVVEVSQMNLIKKIIVRPEHLRPFNEGKLNV